MFIQWWLIVKKKEMTRVMISEKLTPVTIVEIVPQRVIRHKTHDKDWYTALVVWVMGKNDTYRKQKEFNVSPEFPVWYVFDDSLFEGFAEVTVQWISKGKGFVGVIKRHHQHGMPATHGHKFTRVGWSKGNRKPRRVQKGHPHAGHMGDEVITIKGIPLLQKLSFENKKLLILKGSIPGSYNSFVSLYR